MPSPILTFSISKLSLSLIYKLTNPISQIRMSCKKRKAAAFTKWKPSSPTRISISSSHLQQQRSIMELPSHLNMEVLLRLPIKTLKNCRCVCTTWKTLLSDPHFIKLHLSRTPVHLLYKPIPPRSESRQIHLVDLRGGAKTTRRCSRDNDAKMKLTFKSNSPPIGVSFTLLNSCNGLLCLGCCLTDEPLYVCNPILGEYIALPESKNIYMSFGVSGIGFCSDTNKYKVLRTIYYEPDTVAEIYTLGEGKYRSIGSVPSGFSISSSSNAYVNRALHWVAVGGEEKDGYIQSFHFGSEQFRVVPPPAEFDQVEAFSTTYLHLGELHGCLYLLNNFEDSSKVVVWIMNNYGVQESWNRKFVIKKIFPRSGVFCDIFEPIMVMDSGEILIIFNNRNVVLYNPHSESYRNLNQKYGIRSKFEAIAHVPSFLSLKDVAKGEVLEVRPYFSSKRGCIL